MESVHRVKKEHHTLEAIILRPFGIDLGGAPRVLFCNRDLTFEIEGMAGLPARFRLQPIDVKAAAMWGVAAASCALYLIQEKGRPLPKFGEWDENDPSSAEGFTVIFNKARDEKKTGGNPESPGKTATEPHSKPALDPGKPQSKKWFCCIQNPPAES